MKENGTSTRKRNGNSKSNGLKAENGVGETTVKETKNTVDYYDSSDEEDLRNTIGNIPVQWYENEDHVGYDLDGKKIGKPVQKGEIDVFLDKMEDPDYWRKVMDRQTGREVVLTDEQIEKIHALSSGKCPTVGYNPYQPFVDIFSQDSTIHPIDNRQMRKSEFTPSKDEMRQVGKLVYAIKMGWLKPRMKKVAAEKKVYDLWSNEGQDKTKTRSELSRLRMHCPAPKVTLPSHAESYNPPEEYLLTEEEKKKWEEEEEEDRRLSFIPQKYDCLRRLPAYNKLVEERYQRCLDLYLAPRYMKMKLNVKDHTELLPDLPNPKDLKPFPTNLAMRMTGHKGQVRSLSFEPSGTELFVSGGEDGDVRVWSVSSGRCIKVLSVGHPITSVSFCPSTRYSLLAVTTNENKLLLVNIQSGDRLTVSSTTSFLTSLPIGESDSKLEWKRNTKWKSDGVSVDLPTGAKEAVWHGNGDYLATVGTGSSADAVVIHQLSKAKSQMPFTKRKGRVCGVAFSRVNAHLFVATERHVRVYDLSRCQLVKKLQCNIQSISTIRPDNTGHNLFVGGLDGRMSWMDLQLSTKPWKTLRHHKSAIRGVAYHKRLPLLVSVGDDQIVVYHAKIDEDSFNENEVVPVKRLTGHVKVDDKSVLSCEWHPKRAWLLTGGMDGMIALYSY